MFTLPERQLAALREALQPARYRDGAAQRRQQAPVTGKITFVDNTVDPQYGSIRVKAMFGNEEHRLWPGTYANVNATVQVLKDALSVPPQAVVTGPEGRFVYTVQPTARWRACRCRSSPPPPPPPWSKACSPARAW
jgi:multidrug efflux pump subunit AcrA (membrane-fusion protein)